VDSSSSEVKGESRERDCSSVREGRVIEDKKVEISTEEEGGAAHKAVKY
jgi:hypothetical protein